MMRELFVTELVKEILGPRNGSNEIMECSPLSEYITGVLAPVEGEVGEPEGDIIDSGMPDVAEDEIAEQDIHVPPFLSPVLDPQKRPSSFGISFMVESDGEPKADICLTWARYRQYMHRNNIQWQREPRAVIFTINLNKDGVLWFDSKGQQADQSTAEISFHIVARNMDQNRWLVNLYFVNRIKISTEEYARAEHHVFQPQIRVVLHDGTKIVPAEIISPDDSESQELAFLYRNRPVMARGFLCSAVWRDIDPQRQWMESLDFEKCRNEPPFNWPDGQLLPPSDRERFAVPDVRSEFVPIYSIPFPEMNWPSQHGRPPELNANELADTFDPRSLHNALSPFINGYRKWIRQLQQALQSFKHHKQVAQRLISRCQTVLNRMRKGLTLLQNDADVRLSFCFANKAMSLQAQWTRGQPLIWRPFQLGYILTVLESIANPMSSDRDVCDLLWVPTGTGKTEAYLFLIIFTLALRRRRALQQGKSGTGVAVITRYTLRLLTIQQFRRLLAAITACEYLRVDGLGTGKPVGWRPPDSNIQGNFIWGSEPFKAGLWVGGGVTPNRLRDTWGGNRRIPGALSILKGQHGDGEPAQITHCPACRTILAIPATGISGRHTLHFIIHSQAKIQNIQRALNSLKNQSFDGIRITSISITQHKAKGYFTLSIGIFANYPIGARDIDRLWRQHILLNLPQGTRLASARPSRPGYFIRWYQGQRGRRQEYDFEIFCPNPECPLHRPWCAGAPLGGIYGGRDYSNSPVRKARKIPKLNDGNYLVDVQDPFCDGNRYLSDRIPIPAYTVDEQVYHRLPSVVVATVDKFARPPFEARASALFGNVDHYHRIWGYYRKGAPPLSANSQGEHPYPLKHQNTKNYINIILPDPPDLILQDELHLIDGPLGSLVGFYETAIEYLCNKNDKKIKYIASTATVRNAEDQVQAVFTKQLAVFPPPGLTIDDRFFISCLLYTSPSPRDLSTSRMPSSA